MILIDNWSHNFLDSLNSSLSCWSPPRLPRTMKVISKVKAVIEASWHGAKHWVFGQPWCSSSYLLYSQLLGSQKRWSSRQSEAGKQNEVIMLPVFPIMALSGPLFTEMNDGEAGGQCKPVGVGVVQAFLRFDSTRGVKQFVSAISESGEHLHFCLPLHFPMNPQPPTVLATLSWRPLDHFTWGVYNEY